MKFTAEQIARVTHEANRVLQILEEDPAPSLSWNFASEEQRASAVDGVQAALAGKTPEELHENWVRFKTAGGWTYGPVKDELEKTHPCMVPYGDLPEAQQVKDHLFGAIVRTLAGEEDEAAVTRGADALEDSLWQLGVDPDGQEVGESISMTLSRCVLRAAHGAS